jgi:N-formylglutamate deformylase
MNRNKSWELQVGSGPLVATAIHNGHDVRPEVARLMSLSDLDRLREEDPYTGDWTTVAANRVIGLKSRFEVDLNRPSEKAVYKTPADAWGLDVWHTSLPDDVVEQSMEQHRAFYSEMQRFFGELSALHGKFIVFDLHSYNHRREGPDQPAADPAQNPEVNIGTRTMNRDKWGPVIDRFISDLSTFDFLGRRLDVRENVKFGGGYFAAWSHAMFPEAACVIAIEFKKFFMDEWSGQLYHEQAAAIELALQATIPGTVGALESLSL